MHGSRFFNAFNTVLAAVFAFAVSKPAQSEPWVNFNDETATRFPAALLADPYEKDFIFGDVDRNGFADLIVVRMLPFAAADVAPGSGGQRNYLLLNFGGQFFDCAAGAPECTAAGIASDPIPGFADATMDRDVALADINDDGWLDIVTTTTFSDHPRVYVNQRQSAGVWGGFQRVAGAIPAFPSGPKFCAGNTGDVSGDGIPDVFYTDYNNALDDRLLISQGDGTFADVTGARMDASVAEARFGTDAHIVDMDGDGNNDLVKVSGSTCGIDCGDPGSESGVWVHYNVGGNFRAADSVKVYDRAPYMTEPGDFDGDGRIDLYIVDDNQDHLLMNRGGRGSFTEVPIDESPKSLKWGGNVKIADIDADGALDVGLADVDTDEPGCKGAPTPDNWLLLMRGQKIGAQNYRLFDPIALDRSLVRESPWTADLPPWLSQGVYDFDFVDIDNDNCPDLVIGQCTQQTDDLPGVSLSPGGSSDHVDGYKIFMQRYPDLSFTLEEPTGDVLLPAAGSARMLVRISIVTPVDLTPRPADFSVRIGGIDATVINTSRIGRQVWLVVEPSSTLDRAAAHAIAVAMNRCSNSASVTAGNVTFGDPQRTDATLAIDLSTSMDENEKIGAAKNAASLWVDKMNDDDRIGVVWFSGMDSDGFGIADEANSPLSGGNFSISRAGDTRLIGGVNRTNREIAIDAINAMGTISNTPIGEGLLRGLQELNEFSPVDRQRTVVLLSDGQENVARFWADPPAFAFATPPHTPVQESFGAGSANPNVDLHTISFGPTADTELMETIAGSTTNGQHEAVDLNPAGIGTSLFWPIRRSGFVPVQAVDPLPSLTLPNRLANVYEHLHNSASNQQRLWQGVHVSQGRSDDLIRFDEQAPEAALRKAAFVPAQHDDDVHPPAHDIDAVIVPMESGLSFATLSVNWDAGAAFNLSLTPPPGGSPSVKTVRGPTNTVFQIINPTPGDWRLDVRGPKGRQLLIALSGVGDAQGFARTSVPVDGVLAPGVALPVALVLYDRGVPVAGATVVGTAASASGAELLSLQDSGDGVYRATLSKTDKGGAIGVEMIAAWTAADGTPRHRVYRTTAVLPELDSDGDGVSDENETATGGLLDPNNPNDADADPDNDGLPNWKEVAFEGLDPNDADTDDDGLSDGEEFCLGEDPLKRSDFAAARVDSDGDGMPDVWEKRHGLDPTDPSDANRDTDRDGLSNLQEFKHCTSPGHRDSDGDGVADGAEVDAGTSPTDGRTVREPEPGKPEPTPEPTPEPEPDRDSLPLLCWILIAILVCVILVLWWRLIQRP